MLQSENHIFTGMQQDTSISKQSPEYLIDAHNIRITAREGETLLSITNEKGPKELTIKNSLGNPTSISGTIIGHGVLNNYLVLFTHEDNGADRIYRIDMSGEDPELKSLYTGGASLGFSTDYPIDTVCDYENLHIQKVYWTDGLNLPRVINIAKDEYTWEGAFDFVPLLQLNETVTVTRNTGAGGMFPAGVILYAFSYYNKYGQETNLFHVTPLHYISYYNRGGSPESVISNAFTIKVLNVDNHFDYLRIYSILRTSLDVVPTCKRIQDIALDSISNNIVTYIDNGTEGEIVDPASLLFIGGEEIKASSICSKDGTLFLGNISLQRPNISTLNNNNFIADIKKSIVTTTTAQIKPTPVSGSPYEYSNGLNTLAAGFKNREYYRLGLQAQYKNGKWSEPVFIKDYQVNSNSYPLLDSNGTLTKLSIQCILNVGLVLELYKAGYKKVRPVVVLPEMKDRCVLLQGVGNPTMYTENQRNSSSGYALSSWFFRPLLSGVNDSNDYARNSYYYSADTQSPFSVPDKALIYTSRENSSYDPKDIRGVEIQGQYNDENKFKIDWTTLTLHSPDIDFDTSMQNFDWTNIKCRRVGIATFTNTLSDISLLTSSPTISNEGSGFEHYLSSNGSGPKGIISGLFYDDYLVDDYRNDKNDTNYKYRAYDRQLSAAKWMVYLWNKNGSLNNDVNRPANAGARSAVLSKKVVSNLRYSTTKWSNAPVSYSLSSTEIPQVFSSNEVSIVKIGNRIYKGNIDTLLAPDNNDGLYFAFGAAATTSSDGTASLATEVETLRTSASWWKLWSNKADSADALGIYKRVYKDNKWQFVKKDSSIADFTPALATNKEPVRMKYKSTPHMVFHTQSFTDKNLATSVNKYVLPIIELFRDYDANTAFGGRSLDALKANRWVPAGEPVTLVPSNTCTLMYIWGDTWFSRYDCLKTYPFTTEDPNQVVEIGSFMLETRINIDGRYDRNRGQIDNTNMSPVNFNLFNPVYSQRNNFFSYFILDNDYYLLNRFPNQITWSTEKHAGQDVDPWTTVTLASIYNMDGSKGLIRSLNVWGDNIYCFQDNEVSNILFNSRVQIPTSDGVPIEISNNYKVDGKRSLLEGAGCVNKYAICNTPMALYFIDSVGGHLQAIGHNGLTDLSLSKNMVTWLNKLNTNPWKPNDYTTRLFYDKNNRDVYIVTKEEALCYSEGMGLFVSFMSYDNIPVMFNVVDKFYCIKSNYINLMFAGDYNYFFGEYQGYDFTFVSNGKSGQGDFSTLNKIFSNMDFRADKWSDKLDSILSSESPFDYIRVWDEYQDTGEVLLLNKPHKPSPLKKKFRVWRVLIPRNAFNRTDRIRNTWCKIKLGSAPRYNNGNNSFILFHDAVVQYAI